MGGDCDEELRFFARTEGGEDDSTVVAVELDFCVSRYVGEAD